MISNSDLQRLISKGFDLKLISLELKVPMTTLIKIQNSMNYSPNTLSEVEDSKIDSLIARFESIISQDSFSNSDISKILTCVKAISAKQLSIRQSSLLYSLLQEPKLQALDKQILSIITDKIAQKYIQSIKHKQEESNDIEELNSLKILLQKISSDACTFSKQVVQREIESKISKIEEQQVVSKIKYEVSSNIRSIISDLAKGVLDIESAKRIISEEAEKMVSSKPKTPFSLTAEQETKQIMHQIQIAIAEQSEHYPVRNPETTINQISELFDAPHIQSLSCIVDNLIAHKRYDEAKELCNTTPKSKDNFIQYSSRKKIRCAEIGEMIATRLSNNHNAIIANQELFLSIREILRRENLKPASIPLWKSKDGSKNISLADIWPNNVEKER